MNSSAQQPGLSFLSVASERSQVFVSFPGGETESGNNASEDKQKLRATPFSRPKRGARLNVSGLTALAGKQSQGGT